MTQNLPIEWPAGPLLLRRAIFIYEGARLHAASINAPIVPEPWSHRDEEFRAQFLDITERMMGEDRYADAEEAHDSWWQAYVDLGWVYGPERDVDAKTHPDMVPFNQLGWRERIKDAVWIALCELARQFIVDESPYTDGPEENGEPNA